MSKAYYRFYWVRGTTFENSENRVNAKGKAIRYCRENGIDESEIYELSNKSELAYLEHLKSDSKYQNIVSNKKVELVREFTNYNHDEIPPLEINVSFIYSLVAGYVNQKQYVKVVDSVYDLTKQFINEKKLFDYLFEKNNYLQVLYLDQEGNWKEWKIGDKTLGVDERKANHKKMLTQKKVIRDRQKYDRLLQLRQEGKASERQLQELYRLEKVFGG